MLQVQTQETLTRQQGVSYEELETGFWLMSDIPLNFAEDLPYSVSSYVAIELLHPCIKLFLLKEKGSFALFCEEVRREKWMKRKFRLILADLHQYCKPYVKKEARGSTDLSPLRRQALTDFYHWKKFIYSKEYYMNWQEGIGIRNNVLFFADMNIETITKQVQEYLRKLSYKSKKQLILYLTKTQKTEGKRNRKEQRRPKLLPFC